MLRIICVLCALALSAAAAPAPPSGQLTWPMLKAFKGQWKISYSLTKTPNKSEFVPQNCSSQAVEAPCNQPPMSKSTDDVIRVTYQLKDATAPFKTNANGVPDTVKAVMCYTNKSFKDRPWRKFKPVIAKDKSCPYTLGSQKFPTDRAAPLTATFNFNKTTDLVTASWYVKIVVVCQGGQVCQFDETNATSNYFATQKIDVVSNGMIAAAVICSCIGPTMFITYFLLDARRRKNM